jgi:dihydrofolate reductase
MQPTTPIVIVAGLGKLDRAIGYKNNLLWHVPEDLKRFKALTLGHPIIMGKKTFESILSILGKPFPGRTNIVLTRDTDYTYQGVHVAHSIDDALAQAELEHPSEIHIGGGAELYKQILPRVSKLYITWYHDQKEADTFFPAFEDEFEITEQQPIKHHNDLAYQWVDYRRT